MHSTRLPMALAVLAASPVIVACGAGTPGATSAPPPSSVHRGAPATAARSGSWTRFGYAAGRSNAAPRGIDAGALAGLSEHRVALDGTVDSSPIYLAGAEVGGRRRDIVVMTTSYGRTIALDPTGETAWRFTPGSYRSLAGSAQITNATPVADPTRRFVYSASPDGRIHKLRVKDGTEVRSGRWPASVTRDPEHEKLGPALNVAGRFVIAATGGYIGDAPPYQGKVVAIDRSSGRVAHVVNSLCSHRRRVIRPTSCPQSGSAIFGRGSPAIDPTTGRIYVATGNGRFNGRADWGDSVLELSAGARRLRRHFTPTDQHRLDAGDLDLGSASPALLPGGRSATPRYLLQGGKDAKLRLLRLRTSLSGLHGRAGRRLGGQVQTLPAPGGSSMFTAPAVLHRGGSTLAFVATDAGTAGYRLTGGRLRKTWANGTGGSSPVLAGNLLWVYDPSGGLNVYRPRGGTLVRELPAPAGHWNSPIIAGGRAFLPTGDANDHSTSGELSVYAP